MQRQDAAVQDESPSLGASSDNNSLGDSCRAGYDGDSIGSNSGNDSTSSSSSGSSSGSSSSSTVSDVASKYASQAGQRGILGQAWQPPFAPPPAERDWYGSMVAPYGANIQFVLYKRPEGRLSQVQV